MKITKLFGVLFLGTILFTSCSDDVEPNLPKGDYENGILVSGEGTTTVSGSVSYVSNDLSTVEKSIYKKVNKVELGEYVQSISFDKDRAYIITDNQNTITVVNRFTFEKEGTITTGLIKPRYIAIVGDKGYVTNWGATDNDNDDFVAIVNLSSFQNEGKIDVALGPERIVSKNGKLYVSHKGAFGTNNKISVIDISTKKVDKEITIKDKPDELYINNSGKLVVLCEGKTIYDTSWNITGHTKGAITFIDTTENRWESELTFKEGDHPSQMVVSNNSIYYSLGKDIYKVEDNAIVLPTAKLITTDAGYLYGLAVKDNNLYVLDASFTGLSKLNVYDLVTKAKKETKEVALGASKIYFN
ncbi:YncE family protein [Tenacibaculum halocynthiae]|uniref:YncE family protein n=1 Tax=Tenacibaculum halocynthiae TaxID=1254437 RepID=UPI003D64A817